MSLTLTTNRPPPVTLPASSGVVVDGCPVGVLGGHIKQRRGFHCCAEPSLLPWWWFWQPTISDPTCHGSCPRFFWPAIQCSGNGTDLTLNSSTFCPCYLTLLLQAQGFLGPPWDGAALLLLRGSLSTELPLRPFNPICSLRSRRSSHLPI